MKLSTVAAVLALAIAGCATTASEDAATTKNDNTNNTLAVAKQFLTAAGSGDGATLMALTDEDFVWHNEGDSRLPWIGNWAGKQTVFGTFMPAFGKGLSVTAWTTDYEFVNGNQAVFMGTMAADANNTGVNTGLMSWAVRVHVEDGKVKSWNWFEDSYAVSQAYHGKRK
ncbi:MAG: nuclear transport factor 2 family protein [Pseudomonadota bacterium]